MSSVKISSNASGTAIFEITSPATSTNRTQSLPDAAGIFVLDQAVQSLTNKSFDSAPFATVTGTAPIYPCRAWVNFNGTGTVAIRASGNVSSITDNAAGDYTINFTTAMPDVNYSVSAGVCTNIGGGTIVGYTAGNTYSTTAMRIFTCIPNSSAGDPGIVNVQFFR